MNIDKNAKQSIDNISISREEKLKLAQAREHALSNVSSSFFEHFFTTQVLAFASILVIVGLVSFTHLKSTSDSIDNSHMFDELAVLNGEEPIELVENLDFYIWLESQEDTKSHS